jgi:ribonuclease HII
MAVLLPKCSEFNLEAGCDEAGRGCLSGPVVAAAVILPEGFYHPLLNDSKQVSKKHRDELKPYIIENAIAWAVGICSPLEIDEINILNASILAMHKALDQLKIKPEFIAVDGNRFKKYHDIPHATQIKGDARFLNIAAASILAKTFRDEIMENLHLEFPQFAWHSNMGYPTIAHRNAIREFGTTIHHRMTFQLLPRQMKLDL